MVLLLQPITSYVFWFRPNSFSWETIHYLPTHQRLFMGCVDIVHNIKVDTDVSPSAAMKHRGNVGSLEEVSRGVDPLGHGFPAR